MFKVKNLSGGRLNRCLGCSSIGVLSMCAGGHNDAQASRAAAQAQTRQWMVCLQTLLNRGPHYFLREGEREAKAPQERDKG